MDIFIRPPTTNKDNKIYLISRVYHLSRDTYPSSSDCSLRDPSKLRDFAATRRPSPNRMQFSIHYKRVVQSNPMLKYFWYTTVVPAVSTQYYNIIIPMRHLQSPPLTR